ncbi:MAG: hypothetical protein J3R72DRAFT_436678 [Linnemannia gamsii]|nr:MAG: hypothetical protein J3R72DRAFT_436678 [Linnemannia gamsii]
MGRILLQWLLLRPLPLRLLPLLHQWSTRQPPPPQPPPLKTHPSPLLRLLSIRQQLLLLSPPSQPARSNLPTLRPCDP